MRLFDWRILNPLSFVSHHHSCVTYRQTSTLNNVLRHVLSFWYLIQALRNYKLKIYFNEFGDPFLRIISTKRDNEYQFRYDSKSSYNGHVCNRKHVQQSRICTFTIRLHTDCHTHRPSFSLLVSTKPTAYHSNTSPPQEVTFLRTTACWKHEDIMGEESNGNAICFE